MVGVLVGVGLLGGLEGKTMQTEEELKLNNNNKKSLDKTLSHNITAEAGVLAKFSSLFLFCFCVIEPAR